MITIDEYYDIPLYIEALQALRNNRIEYKEYISTKSPFNWYIDMDQNPVMINYDVLPNNQQKFLLNKVEPATPTEKYIYERKEQFDGVKALKHYSMNKPLEIAEKSDYACFFAARNRVQLQELSKNLGTIYYFGKYYGNKYRIALCTNKMIKNFVNVDEILVTKTSSVTQMELDLNFKIFRLNDRLRKFTEQPTFKNGKLQAVKIKQFDLTI